MQRAQPICELSSRLLPLCLSVCLSQSNPCTHNSSQLVRFVRHAPNGDVAKPTNGGVERPSGQGVDLKGHRDKSGVEGRGSGAGALDACVCVCVCVRERASLWV